MTDTAPRPDNDRPQDSEPQPSAAALVFDDPLSRPSRDDTDEGWGDRPSSGGAAADLARFLEDKPPHHL
ncbi:hypothetical protein [Streptomyces sp. TR06-5]|uniref:hypothetical protein n=1 Tax=unclassified Streptomyces TaxID=2593676 RepID=UPI0039A0B054